MFKVNNEDTRTTPCRSGVFSLNFEHVCHLPSVSIVKFEHIVAG